MHTILAQSRIIPKAITKGEELVVITRKQYEMLLDFARDKIALEEDLKDALEEVREGKMVGPFNDIRRFKRYIEA